MNVQNRAPSRGRGRTVKKTERYSQEEILQQLLDDHKKNLGEVVSIRINDRTTIEVSASMSEKEREERVENYLKNINYKPAKRG